MIGKAVKLAEGHLDTHSKKVTMNKEFIQDIAHRTGCNEDVLTAIRNMNLARELWDIIPAEKLETFSKLLTRALQTMLRSPAARWRTHDFINQRRRKNICMKKALMINVHGDCRIRPHRHNLLSPFMQRRESELPASTESTLAVIRE